MSDEVKTTQLPTDATVVRYGPKTEAEPAAEVLTEPKAAEQLPADAVKTPDDVPQETSTDASFPADIIARAQQFGLDSESFKSSASLERVLSILEAKPAEARQQEPDEPVEPYKLDLGDDVEESISKALAGMNQHYAEQISKIKAKAENASAKAEAVTGRTAEQIFEQQLTALGEGWEDVFGKGRTRSLDHRTSAYKNRAKLVEAIKDLHGVNQTRGNAPADEELFQKSLLMSFGDKYEKIIRAQVAAQLKKTTLTIRPEQRNGTSSAIADDPDSKARAFASGFLRERGF